MLQVIAERDVTHCLGFGGDPWLGHLQQISGRVSQLKDAPLPIRANPGHGHAAGSQGARNAVQVGRGKRHMLKASRPVGLGYPLELDPLVGSDLKADQNGVHGHFGEPGPLAVESPKGSKVRRKKGDAGQPGKRDRSRLV